MTETSQAIDLSTIDPADVEFFYDHAAWSYQPGTQTRYAGRLEGAIELATAEVWAREVDAEITWQGDDLGDWHAMDENPVQTCELAALRLGGRTLASLGCIDDAGNDYRRVVAAELASEARALLVDMVKAAV